MIQNQEKNNQPFSEGILQRRVRKWKITLGILLATLVGIIVVSVSIGPIPISPTDVIAAVTKKVPLLGSLINSPVSAVNQEIVLVVRLPRVLAAALVGVGLASSGTVLQGLLRNPMADPYIIGVSAGASLGATIASVLGLGFSIIGSLYSVPLFAFAGAIITVFMVYSISRRAAGVSMLTLLLVGIAVTSFFSAMVTLLRIVSSDMALSIVFWLIGSLNLTTWNYVYLALPFIVVGFAISLLFSRDLTALSLGEEQATHLGVETENVKKILLFSVSMMTAAAVSISGVIGFIGLIIPHIMRLIVGPDYRILTPASAAAGAIVLIACDTLSRTILNPSEIPVGIITALFGGPFFIYLLTKKKNNYE
jgi:iron complex transport system permease protein